MSRRSIEDFKSTLKNGGVRPTMYECEIYIPRYVRNIIKSRNSGVDNYSSGRDYRDKFSMLCKATTIPSSLKTTVSVGLPGGAALKLPGSRIYEPWSVTVINDQKMTTRSALEVWSSLVIGMEAPLGPALLENILGKASVTQLDKEGNPIRSYELRELYPTNIQSQDVAYDQFDTISEFTCEFAFHYLTVKNSKGKAIE
nr:hypothetical protein 36 [bacterium]